MTYDQRCPTALILEALDLVLLVPREVELLRHDADGSAVDEKAQAVEVADLVACPGRENIAGNVERPLPSE